MALNWPDDGKPADFEHLVDPICEAIRFAYAMQRQNRNKDIPYTGLEIGKDEQATCLKALHQLSAERMIYSEEDQGRDALTEIVGLAIRLGIEQGRRMSKYSSEYRALETWANIGKLFAEKDSSDHK